MERWLSGLKRWFAKSIYLWISGVRIPFFPINAPKEKHVQQIIQGLRKLCVKNTRKLHNLKLQAVVCGVDVNLEILVFISTLLSKSLESVDRICYKIFGCICVTFFVLCYCKSKKSPTLYIYLLRRIIKSRSLRRNVDSEGKSNLTCWHIANKL